MTNNFTDAVADGCGEGGEAVAPLPEMEQVEERKFSDMGITKSTPNKVDTDFLINVVNENIKTICLHSDYKSSEKCQSMVKQLINLLVNSTDNMELNENIENAKLTIFTRPLTESDIRDLFNSKELKDKEFVGIETNTNNKTEILHKIIVENIRIVRKLPSFNLDEASQTSVRKVMEIIEDNCSNDVALCAKLQEAQLSYFTEADKTKFWQLKDHSMSRATMDPIEEDQVEREEEEQTEGEKTDTRIEENPLSLKEPTHEIIEKVEIVGKNQSNRIMIEKTDDEQEIRIDKEDIQKEEAKCETGEENNLIFMENPMILVNETEKEIECTSFEIERPETTNPKDGIQIIAKIINTNIEKLQREENFESNETLQRKVKTVANIIEESSSEADILDRIELEGLQYFVDFCSKEKNSEESAELKTSVDYDERRRCSGSERKKLDRTDSIVSKILKEVSKETPKRNNEEMIGKSSYLRKEIGGDGKCTITRDKASRKVKKYKQNNDKLFSISPQKKTLPDLSKENMVYVDQNTKGRPGNSFYEVDKATINEELANNKTEVVYHDNENLVEHNLLYKENIVGRTTATEEDSSRISSARNSVSSDCIPDLCSVEDIIQACGHENVSAESQAPSISEHDDLRRNSTFFMTDFCQESDNESEPAELAPHETVNEICSIDSLISDSDEDISEGEDYSKNEDLSGFDLNMQRLNFIENSFKNIFPTEDDKQPSTLQKENLSAAQKLERIQKILDSSEVDDVKLQEIEKIVNIVHQDIIHDDAAL